MRVRLAMALAVAGLVALTGCSAENPSPDLSDAELSLIEEQTQELAESMGIDNPPSVQIERVITLDEWAETIASCMQEDGFEVSASTDGEGIEFPPNQNAALRASLNEGQFVCEARYPVHPSYYEPLSDAQLRDLYAYQWGTLVQCLEERGLTVDATAPSETAFIESEGSISPYGSVNIPPEEMAVINRECPQAPDGLY